MIRENYRKERALQAEGYTVIGIDEVGRGCIAGDVYAAAVILPTEIELTYLRDSKKISEKNRELYAVELKQIAKYCVGVASIAEIEEHNILQATFLAMQRALAGLEVANPYVLVDGNQFPFTGAGECIIGGDDLIACISAASIIAKTTRDAYMRNFDQLYPGFSFSKHKGYGTQAHYAALSAYGCLPIHRLSFLKKFLNQEQQNG
ncbi:MAG: ribonuclease HII [Clostridia bacterium]